MTWDQLKMQKLRVYTTSTCGDCRRLKATLASKGVPYTEVNIETDAAAAADLVARAGHRAIPYVEVNGGKLIKGWHKDAPGRWDEATFLADAERSQAAK